MLDNPVDFRPIPDNSKLEPKLAQLLAYWQSKRKPGLIPARGDIDPIDIPRLMADVALVDILRDPLDYRYRLVGTRLVEMMGSERTGLRMREVFPPQAVAATVTLMERLLARREPLAFEGRMVWLERDYRVFQALVLPLTVGGEQVDMAIMGIVFLS
ncbi:MAG TPA: PAS domain-containing protein [Parvibaculum sp.]